MDSVKPYLVVDTRTSSGKDKSHHPYEAFLKWLRAEGIDPEKGNRCEVYEGRDGKPPYAIVHLFEVDADGRKIFDEVTGEAVTYADIVALSSLPPSWEV
ncbi:hypothetical protein [Nonomuraea sp. NPDC048901]|uniref:hypothetical protein n=1 Tax=Nonomuraea sp. NPDC048901 TaxID=3155627 RepID=UPI0033F3D09D